MDFIENARFSKAVADRLQAKIITLGLTEGAKLPTEPALMAEFGVSRTVIREAAALLVSRGIVEVRPRRGMTVRAPDGQGLSESLIAQLQMSKVSLPQLLQVRLTLESAIARIAASERTDEDIEKLNENLQMMSAPDIDRSRTIELDIAFHELLASATHNPFFQIVTRPINELLRRLYIDKTGYMSLREKTCVEHRAIVTAILNREPDAAALATNVHLERVGQSVEKLIAEIGGETP